MNKSDIIGLFSILIMFIGVSLITYYIIVEKTNKCINDPLKYAVEEIMKNETENYTYVKLDIFSNQFDIVPFRSRRINIENNLTNS